MVWKYNNWKKLRTDLITFECYNRKSSSTSVDVCVLMDDKLGNDGRPVAAAGIYNLPWAGSRTFYWGGRERWSKSQKCGVDEHVVRRTANGARPYAGHAPPGALRSNVAHRPGTRERRRDWRPGAGILTNALLTCVFRWPGERRESSRTFDGQPMCIQSDAVIRFTATRYTDSFCFNARKYIFSTNSQFFFILITFNMPIVW